ncbi:MAG: glycosyltransferase family 39 protein [Cyclobacteriaceae bacterium]|nr:glycosyltransferase family 39 protein [Cyclobacteriaceae bacterium]
MKKFLGEILRLENITWRHWIVIFIAFLFFHIPVVLKSSYHSNLAVHQAEAFLHKKLDIDKYFWDASVFEGKYYVCFPPVPALIMVPFVAIFGITVNTVIISLLITCLSMFLLYRLLCRWMTNISGRKWVFGAFFLGSGYWLVLVTSDHINGFAHVVCTALLFFLLLELTGKKRPIWIGCFWALAFLTRQMAVFYAFLIFYFLYFENPDKKAAIKNLVTTGLTFGFFSTIYLMFNYFRFHDFFETGYQYLVYQSSIRNRVDQYGIFSFHYFFYNLYHMFIKGHNIFFSGSNLLSIKGMDLFGTSIIAASPFVIFSVKADAKKNFLISFWVTIISILIGVLLYHNNGWMQVNAQRFSLDFFPALIVLVALSYNKVPFWLFRLFTLYAIALNVFSFLIHSVRS